MDAEKLIRARKHAYAALVIAYSACGLFGLAGDSWRLAIGLGAFVTFLFAVVRLGFAAGEIFD